MEHDRLAAKHESERQFYERHPEMAAVERVSRYKQMVIERMRARQWAMLGDLRGKDVLEIGCGVGQETVELARRGARVVALDLSPTLVEQARARVTEAGFADRVSCEARAAEHLAGDGRRFEVVLGNGVLHHLDLVAFKPTLVQLMADGGIAQFAEPMVHNPLLRLYRLLTPALHTPEEAPLSDGVIARFLEGFQGVRVEHVNLSGLLLLPLPYLVGMAVARRALAGAAWLDHQLLYRFAPLARYSQYVIIQVGAARAGGAR